MSVSFGTLESSLPLPEAPDWSTPFRVGVFGDFTGRANRQRLEDPEALKKRKPRKIDRGNFEEVMAALDVALELPIGADTFALKFQSLDDFDADAIYQKVDKFTDLDTRDEKSELMSAILHHPDFQALESAWRGLDWILRRIWKSDNGVEAVLYDFAPSEFAADLNAQDDLTQSALYYWIIEKATQGHEGQPWAVLVGNYWFKRSAEDCQVLGRFAKIARQAAAPFLAGIDGPVWDKADVPADADAWNALRQQPEAALIGLAAPRFLLRPPFGANTKPVEKFDYEEFRGPQDKGHYLWANPAFACAMLLGLSFTKKSWSFKPGANLDLDNLAMHVYTEDGDTEAVVAQTWLTRPQVEHMSKQGIMAFLCVKGQNAMQLFKFLALAQPPKDKPQVDLVGSWGQKELKGIPRTSSKPKFDVSVGMVGAPEAAKSAAPAKKSKAAPRAEEEQEVEASETPEEETSEPEATEEAASASGAEELDPELAALMSSLEGAGEEKPAEEEPSAEPEMDPELAAMMKELEGGGSEPAAEEASAEEAMDPELAALMKSLEGGDETPAAEESSDAEAAPPDEGMDPELAALMKQLEGGGEEEKPAEEAGEEAMDPELAALMKSLEGGDEAEAKTEEAEPVSEEMDAELAALMKSLETPEEE